ncbi:transcription termination factor MTERF8, chloroplastic [Cryptomeria japonica]|uniref:transcription termination factor MTERF8, chloroplastic n=1 Tax=Cryptomeria japonica TaxID=3369 RepID=UPI0025AD8042|nr:transcription termination factor MTERF8, chloroplastic [Cryptomeria japonica]XP_057823368.1 transcription termination factor MTERF8, chloroplastic [Cryptomeria japonica]XP_057823369.1 transcription termination factor MTERF8, chloroplastic [Cryptomeria japonica]XP_057823370.1 transcription termination factor MTERF8, chloroplastic [Cryptomeria japonica]XP_057823371.1 transcription termination factor MTERF8, chloroplastic [Cryptomeria japonica]XP_057823372.1 transcription termination factor MT
MSTTLCCNLFVVVAAPMNSILCCKLFSIRPFHFRNVFSTIAHSQSLVSLFDSSKLNMSEADITRILKLAPQFQNPRALLKVEQFIHSLKKHGCSEVQIAKIMKTMPRLIGRAEGTLEPKLKLLEDFGFVDRNLAKLLTINPSILCNSLNSSLLPKMVFLKEVFQSQDVLVKALLKSPRLLSFSLEKNLKPSFAFWQGWGFCGTGLFSFLRVQPDVLSRTSLTPARVDLIHKIGVDKESKMFKYIVSIVAVSRVETLEAKIENLKYCGLSAEEIWQLFGACPLLLKFSKENVKKKMDFLVNTMELPANYAVKHPGILTVSLEKTTRPRFLVWQKIKSINDFNIAFFTVLLMTEARFVSKIIKGHPESQTLWTIYENAISDASNRTLRTESSTKP